MASTLARVGSGPGDALDAGMGPGRLCEELQQQGWTVFGLDASSEMVALARRRLPEAADRLMVGTIEQLPFADGSFDRVVATGVLEYANARQAVGELARVLRSGGRAIVSYPNAAALYRYSKTLVVYPLVRLLRRSTPAEAAPRGAGAIQPDAFEDMLQSIGLEPLGYEYTSYLPMPAPFDRILPRASHSAGRRLEGRGGRLESRLAVQVVYSARKP